ncbi:hypothetical protein KC19_11G009900 [Ceratodon purpureus]|uniref:COMM domain-containing protein n=1 Tax=Ceratodon purpureus TaxID=3225 RepID=A0A8T0G9L4_CERPU|nr:hypothetical protein KC19_11G009900 [Ceratodon purpureus]
MKFHLCGGLDAPDWILANIVTLSTIPSTRVKVLVEYIIHRIAEGTFDYDSALKITTDASLGVSDAKACIAALHFMVSNAAKFDVEDSTLSRELQQLGLPKEHTDAVVRPYWERREALQTKLLQESLQLPSLEVKAWQIQSGDTRHVVMRLKSTADDTEQEKDEAEDFVVSMTVEKFRVLHHGNVLIFGLSQDCRPIGNNMF